MMKHAYIYFFNIWWVLTRKEMHMPENKNYIFSLPLNNQHCRRVDNEGEIVHINSLISLF